MTQQVATTASTEETAHSLMRADPSEFRALTPAEMLSRAIEKGVDVESLGKLVDLNERWEQNQARKAFNHAIAAAKAALPAIVRNREVDFTTGKGRTNYRHEDFGQIARQVDPVLSEHGLSYRFRTEQREGGMIEVTCVISHEAGHSVENSLCAGRDESGNKNNIQAVGSTVTYLQRYTLKAALGLAATHDDDAKGADAPKSIDDKQVSELKGLIDDTDTDVRQFCEHFGIDSLAALPVTEYGRAKHMLRAKAAQQQKAKDKAAEGADASETVQ
ncbi:MULTISPECIES: ERF family protein [Hyphobacterium]|uniref:ERF family protein n=1 Tax=Hyphobacterium vulgare TaxID=1736751 RepID=A0ABV6ZU99_9PROT